jgi:hypothetical protein
MANVASSAFPFGEREIKRERERERERESERERFRKIERLLKSRWEHV